MLPFDGLFFFYLLVILLLPAVMLGLFEKPLKAYGMAVNLILLLIIFNPVHKFLLLCGFFIWELILTKLWQKLLTRKKNPTLLWLLVLLSVLPLIVSKAAGMLGFSLSLLGISYMTFRVIQIILESYDGLIKKTSIFHFYYFVLFFPSVSSGPVDRSRRFEKDLGMRYSREEYFTLLKDGVWKLFTGALYNFVFSRLIYEHFLSVLPEKSVFYLLGYAAGYTFFLFFNFAGYSLMAIGTAYILGIRLPENFNFPFISRDLKEFWSRWHISLSTWMRDFVYTRFVMSSLRGKWFKSKHTGSYLGYIITMTTMGVWHGFELRYLVYGLYHGFFMCLNDWLDNNVKSFKKLKNKKRLQPLFIVLTFIIYSTSLLIFSGKLI